MRSTVSTDTPGRFTKYILRASRIHSGDFMASQAMGWWWAVRRVGPRVAGGGGGSGCSPAFFQSVPVENPCVAHEVKPAPNLIEKTVRNLREIAPTLYYSVPRGYEALLPFLENDEQLRTNFFSRLKVIQYSGAALPAHYRNCLKERCSPSSAKAVWSRNSKRLPGRSGSPGRCVFLARCRRRATLSPLSTYLP